MMVFLLALALLLPALGALVALHLLWPHQGARAGSLPLQAALALGLGLGLSSITYFCWLLLFGASRAFIWLELVLLAALAIAWWSGRRRSARTLRSAGALGSAAPSTRPGDGAFEPQLPIHDPVLSRSLAGAYCVALLAWLLSFVTLTLAHPHGNWDATTIWNMRARFLFRGAADWQDAFSGLLGVWTHTDYPLLLPAAVARAWSFSAAESTLGPAAVAFLFTLGGVGLLTAVVARLRGREQGMLAGIVLLATVALIRQGPTQYADIPLGYFILASFVCLALCERSPSAGTFYLLLAGLTAGLAAWSKNEGLLFLPALLVSYGGVALKLEGRRAALRRCGTMLLGLVPVLVLIVGFKWLIAPSNDLLASFQVSTALQRLGDLSRYGVVGGRFTSRFLQTGGWLLSVGLAVYLILVGVKIDERDRPVLAVVATTVALVLAGYFLVYVLTPHDLDWHLGVSLYRLMLHVWPALLLLFFLIARPPLSAGGEARAVGQRFLEQRME